MRGISVSILLVVAIVLIAGFILSSNLTGEFHLFKRTGKLNVISIPSGANVYVDNVYKGQTPITITKLSVGQHVVKLTKAGYNNYITTISITAGKTTKLNVVLTPISPTALTKPDLVVSNITFTPAVSATRGTFVNITAIISNIGNATANNFYIEFRHLVHTNSLIGEKFVSSLSAGSNTTLNIQQWNTTSEVNGTHTIRVRADSKFNVTEWNEVNNDRNVTYQLT